jgi:hypothetical protein
MNEDIYAADVLYAVPAHAGNRTPVFRPTLSLYWLNYPDI